MRTWATSIVAALALLVAGCGEEPGGNIVGPDRPQSVTERGSGLAIADNATLKAGSQPESRFDQVYILIDRTCPHGVSYRYVRFASDEAEKWYRYHQGYSYVPVAEASSQLRAAARQQEIEPGAVYTYLVPS